MQRSDMRKREGERGEAEGRKSRMRKSKRGKE